MENALLICTGCGTTKTIRALRRRPEVISCCPERDMREAQEFFVVPRYSPEDDAVVFDISAIFEGRTDIVLVQHDIASLPIAQRIRRSWYSK